MSRIIKVLSSILIVLLHFTKQAKCIEEPTFRYVTAYDKVGRLLRSNDIEKTTVNVLKPIIFLISGLDKNETRQKSDWYKDLMEAYLEKQVHNVFIVDWNSNAKSSSIENQTQSTGPILANFIGTLFNKTGESFLNIHLVSSGAGARVAAAAASLLAAAGRRVNRITALEPVYYAIKGGSGELSSGNADFVDVVTTDLTKLQKEGHVRFYLDCENRSFGELTAGKVFARSINSDEFKGIKCGSVQDFKEGRCGAGEEVVFGENVDRKVRGDYFVRGC